MTILSFLFFMALVGVLTSFLTREDDHTSSTGFFLAGRSLTFPLIAGSLLLTNLSTEQMVGLNGAAFTDGLSVMVWEVIAVIALVGMALYFLPKFLRSGVTTVPEYLEIRFDHGTQVISNLIFLSAYVFLLLPIILYTGATGMIGILNVQELLGIQSHAATLWLIIWVVGLIGSMYALFGGLRTVAVSDTINGIGLLAGGFMITGFGLHAVSDGGGISEGLARIAEVKEGAFNSIGGPETSVPFSTIFTGILLLNFFYWCTNQQIIQRTFGASSLAEGQKGVLLTGLLKLLGPVYLVLPGLIAVALFAGQDIKADHAYGRLVNQVLPAPLTGFFAAAMIGAILSSFNSVLNSSCTLFSLGLYKNVFRPGATEARVVRSGKVFGWIVAFAAMSIAPLLANTTSIFGYLQKMNGMYSVPIFAVVFTAMATRRVPPLAAKTGLIGGVLMVGAGYWVEPFKSWAASMHDFHFIGLVFAILVLVMLAIGWIKPGKAFVQEDVKAVDMTPWKHAKWAGAILCLLVLLIYVSLADFSVLSGVLSGLSGKADVL